MKTTYVWVVGALYYTAQEHKGETIIRSYALDGFGEHITSTVVPMNFNVFGSELDYVFVHDNDKQLEILRHLSWGGFIDKKFMTDNLVIIKTTDGIHSFQHEDGITTHMNQYGECKDYNDHDKSMLKEPEKHIKL